MFERSGDRPLPDTRSVSGGTTQIRLENQGPRGTGGSGRGVEDEFMVKYTRTDLPFVAKPDVGVLSKVVEAAGQKWRVVLVSFR